MKQKKNETVYIAQTAEAKKTWITGAKKNRGEKRKIREWVEE